jgi:hypothetical protein
MANEEVALNFMQITGVDEIGVAHSFCEVIHLLLTLFCFQRLLFRQMVGIYRHRLKAILQIQIFFLVVFQQRTKHRNSCFYKKNTQLFFWFIFVRYEEEPVREAIPAQFATLAGNNRMNIGRMAVGKRID